MNDENKSMEQPKTWHDVRATGIGASEIGTILGISPWGSQLEIFGRKLGLVPPIDSNERMAVGRWLEGPLIEWYGDETKRPTMDPRAMGGNEAGKLARLLTVCPDAPVDQLLAILKQHCTIEWCGDEGLTLRSIAHPFLTATCDAFTFDRERGTWGAVEVKVTQMAWPDGPPAHYVAQLQQQLLVTGLQWGAFAALIRGERGHIDQDADTEMHAAIIEAGGAFWQRVEANEPPDVTGSTSDAFAIRFMFPHAHAGESVTLPDEATTWDEEYVHHKAEEKMHREMKKAAETKLRAAMADASIARVPNGAVWSSSDRAPVEVKASTRPGWRGYNRRAPRKAKG